MSLGRLALIGICELAGPLLSSLGRGAIPAVVGEILAGVMIGRTGLDVIHTGGSTLSFLSDVGFAMLMLSVGMNVPVREQGVRSSLPRGTVRALVVAVLAAGAGLLVAQIHGVGHPAVYAVVLASGSAAVVLPILQERRLDGRDVLYVIAQVTVADVGATVAIPFVLVRERPARRRRVRCSSPSRDLRHRPPVAPGAASQGVPSRGQAAALGHRPAGFPDRPLRPCLDRAANRCQPTDRRLRLGADGGGDWGPKRLSTEVLGVGGGLFVPLFFVVLGARLDLRGLFAHPAMVGLALAIAALTLVVHLLGAVATRQRPAAGLLASAQLGVPSAVVVLGLSERVITATQAAAIIAAALISLATCAAGAAWLGRRADAARTESTLARTTAS